jgi:hypothetical protein
MGCGCNDAVLTVPCTEPTDCTENCNCPLKLGSICVLYDGEELLTLQVVEGEDLTSILKKINDLLNTALNPDNLYLNIGTGAELWKQVNTLSQAEFRTIVSSNASLTITQNADEIDIVTAVEDTTASNVGTGEGLFKQKVGADLEFKTIVSDTLDITQNGADEVQIEYNDSFNNLPRYIVNNLYVGSEELGTAAKPFKTIAAALTEFIGTGDANNPENAGATIIVQEGNTYTHTGHFSYRDLNMIFEENVEVTHNPSTGGYFCDLDSVTTTGFGTRNKFEVKSGAEITLTERGFRNIGSIQGSTYPKEIEVTGSGRITLSGARQAGYALIECNTGNSSGYNMPAYQNFTAEGVTLKSTYKDVYNVGRDADVVFINCTVRHSDVGTVIDDVSESFNQTGGEVTFRKSDIFIVGDDRTNGFTLTKDPSFNCSLVIDRSRLVFPGNITNLFVNKSSATNYPSLEVTFFSMTDSNAITNIFDSPFVWQEDIVFKYNTFYSGTLDDTKVDLTNNNTTSVSNNISGQQVLSLQSFADRTTAALSLGTGAVFVNTNSSNPDPATHFIDMVI